MKIQGIIVLLLVVCCSQPKQMPKATQGVLDLRSWNFSKDGPVNLDGEWEFYWKEFCDPNVLRRDVLQCVSTEDATTGNINVPGNWNSYIHDGKPLDVMGYATYRLKVLVPENENFLSLYMPTMGTAYQMWINGREISQNGKVGKSEEEMVLSYQPQVVNVYNHSEEYDIVVWVSNFYHGKKAGIWGSIQLGQSDDILKKYNNQTILDWLTFGSLFIMGLYHLGLYSLRREDPSTLWFGLFCIVLALRAISLGNHFLHHFLPEQLSWLAFKIEYLTAHLGLLYFSLFLHYIFLNEFSKKVLYVVLGIGGFLTLIVVLFSSTIFTVSLIAFQILLLLSSFYNFWVMVLALKHKRQGSILFLGGFLILFLAILNDILSTQGVIYTEHFTSISVIAFIFSQSLMLSIRFSNAFKESEIARADAEEQKAIAEQRKLEIEKLNKTKDEFLANLSHEIKTPLSIVFAYSEMLSTGEEYSEEVKEYSSEIYTHSNQLNDYISDVIFVTEIESNFQLRKSDVYLKTLFLDIIKKNKPFIEEKEIQLDLNVSENLVIHCDPSLMKKALSAVVKNAIVYNKPKGSVIITSDIQTDNVAIRIIDTGIGIAPEHQNKVFEKFFRVDSSLTYTVSGVGIGLFLAKKIIELHGGKILLESEKEQSSTFILQIPIDSVGLV
jgi:signal transduction histidine kinase